MKNKIFVIASVLVFLLIGAGAVQAASATYLYDKVGRLVRMTADNGTVIVYSYDAAGNRTARTITCGATGC